MIRLSFFDVLKALLDLGWVCRIGSEAVELVFEARERIDARLPPVGACTVSAQPSRGA